MTTPRDFILFDMDALSEYTKPIIGVKPGCGHMHKDWEFIFQIKMRYQSYRMVDYAFDTHMNELRGEWNHFCRMAGFYYKGTPNK